MTDTNNLFETLSKHSEMQEQLEREYEADCDQFWNNLSYDDQLKAFFSVCKRIYQGDVKDRRSYRGVPCANKAKLLNVEHSHSISTGCWVKVNDRYLPIAEVVAIERDGKTIIAPKAPIRMEINK
jgi:hypothetical protein